MKTSPRIFASSNPTEQRLGILPMAELDRQFWKLFHTRKQSSNKGDKR